VSAAAQPTSKRASARIGAADVFVGDAERVTVSTARKVVRFAVGTVSFPFELATTTLRILRLTEELLEEVVYLLRSTRPIVDGVSSAYRGGHLDPVFRTLGQLQQSANVIAFVWTPIDAVRGVIAPRRP